MSRNNSSSVLQSLTATYTDSEGEDEMHDNGKHSSPDNHELVGVPSERESTVATTAPSTASPDSVKSGTSTPQSGSSLSAKEIQRRVAARLVSYNNDEAMSEDDAEDDEADSNSRVEFPVLRASRPVSPAPEPIKLLPGEELLPPEPTGKCPTELQDKITNVYERMKQGMNLNYNIQQRKHFRNPSIYEKLIEHVGIEEIGTNYPSGIYDPYQWGEEDFYEHLSKVQREEMEKREKERRERTKVEFVSGTASKKPASSAPGEEEKKRKSKWDQAVPAAGNPTTIATVTTVASGTKMAIPAFGSLPKKTKPA